MWSRDSEARKPEDSTAPLNEVHRGDDPAEDEKNPEDYEDSPEIAVSRAEARAREEQRTLGTKKSAILLGGKRNYAEALHRQAELLHHRGDYESALVLYHRAASVYPRELSHGVAARRTAAVISSAASDPSRALRNLPPGAKNTCHPTAVFCPETAALRAKKIVEESSDPVSSINQILKYFDSRKDLWRDSLGVIQDDEKTPPLPRSRITLRRLSGWASVTLKHLQAAFASGDSNESLKMADELLVISEALPNRYRYQVAARHYLAMTQVALRRHDRAVDQVSRMVRLARESGDVALRSRSMMTLGKVHLSFGHLEAAARAWERLLVDVAEAVPKAWLLHEIGRCYFEMKRYAKALEIAGRCVEYAEEGNSRKWLMHGKLLSGQSLVELGRLGEAVGVLKVAAGAARDERDSETREYLSSLIDSVTAALRTALSTDELVQGDAKPWIDETTKSRAKSDETLDSRQYGRTTDWFARSNARQRPRGLAPSRQSRVTVDGSFGRTTKTSSRRARRKNARNGNKRGRKNHPDECGNSRLSVSASRGSGTFHRLEFAASLEPGKTRIVSSVVRDDLAEARDDDDDDDDDDELTSRTRIIRKETRKGDGISTQQPPGYLDESKHFPGEKANSAVDDRSTSDRKFMGKCPLKMTQTLQHAGEADEEDVDPTLRYFHGGKIVIDEQADSSPDDEQSDRTGRTYDVHEKNDMANNQSRCSSVGDKNLAVDIDKQFHPDKGEIIQEVDNSNYAEYSPDRSTRNLGIDEGAEEEEEAAAAAAAAFSPGHRTVFSSCESKFSFASTGRTYVVRETKTMSLCETASRYVDYEKTMRSQGGHDSRPSALGPSPPALRPPPYTRRHGDGKILGGLVVDTTGDERCEIAATLGDQPVNAAESISVPRSYGQRSLYRHSLPSSPRKQSQPEVVTSITRKQ